MQAARPWPQPAAWMRPAVVAVFSLQFVAITALLDGVRAYDAEPRVVISAVQSALLWGLVALPAARSRLWRAGAALAAAMIVVLQLAFHARYGSYIDAEVVRSTVRFWADIKPELSSFLPTLSGLVVLAAAIEYGWLSLSWRNARSSP